MVGMGASEKCAACSPGRARELVRLGDIMSDASTGACPSFAWMENEARGVLCCNRAYYTPASFAIGDSWNGSWEH